ncbi:multi-sensor hybrid histidine kinase [Olavius algarvensis Delta 1 endosymbiont]|nr:multi-sensor hybrid histidine kinase [Olavius algarvensis Delta 1 endosymbiont]
MEEYVWISKARDPESSDPSRPVLLRMAEYYGVRISIVDPEYTDTEAYLKAVNDAIRRRVAGLMIVGWGDPDIIPVVNAAVNSGIPVVCVDQDIPASNRHAYVGTDWCRMGTAMAENLAAFIDLKGRVLVLGAFDSDHVKDGIRGFRQQIARYADIEILTPEAIPAADYDAVHSAAEACIGDHDGLDGLAAFDGSYGSVAAGVLERMDLSDSVKLICAGADDSPLRLVRSGAIDAAFYRPSEVSTCRAFQLLHDYNHGSEATGHTPGVINIPGSVDTGFIIVTNDNIDTFDSDIRLDQAIQHHESSQQLSLISSMIESVEELAIAADNSGRIVYANAASLRFCGYLKKELVGRGIDELFDFTSIQSSQITKCVEDETAKSFEAVAIRKDGSQFPAHISVSPLRSETAARGIAIIATNISERNRSRKALIDSHVRFLTVLDSIDADIYVADMDDYEILLVNQHMRESFGEDLVGKTCYEVFRTGTVPCSPCTNEQLVDSSGKPAGPCVWEGENPITGKWYINYDRAIRWVDGRLVRLQIATDITRIKELEKESLRIQAQLQQAQKMEAIGTLAGGIAHDFNNILSAVIGYTEIVLGDVPESTSQHRNLQEVLTAGNRARDLVNQILMFSRQSEKRLKAVQVNRIVIEALKLLRASLPTTIRIEPRLLSNSAVLADATQIHQVIMNLCTNAAHAMRENGGLLKVELSDTSLDGSLIERYPSLTTGTYINLAISDSGYGMEENLADRIFDPFFTTKERGEGTGMGLAVVLGIVKSHGGAITVESALDQGSRFDVYLPIIETKADTASRQEVNMPTGMEKVLLLDDEKALIDLGYQILDRLGYVVTTRTSSLEALELFRAQPDKFDLVITDMTMPNMTGDEFAAKIMTIRADIPVILCTGYSERISIEPAHKLKIDQNKLQNCRSNILNLVNVL